MDENGCVYKNERFTLFLSCQIAPKYMALAFYYRHAHALPQANIHASKMADIGTLQELPFYLMRKHVHRINVTQSELCTGKR